MKRRAREEHRKNALYRSTNLSSTEYMATQVNYVKMQRDKAMDAITQQLYDRTEKYQHCLIKVIELIKRNRKLQEEIQARDSAMEEKISKAVAERVVEASAKRVEEAVSEVNVRSSSEIQSLKSQVNSANSEVEDLKAQLKKAQATIENAKKSSHQQGIDFMRSKISEA